MLTGSLGAEMSCLSFLSVITLPTFHPPASKAAASCFAAWNALSANSLHADTLQQCIQMPRGHHSTRGKTLFWLLSVSDEAIWDVPEL